MPGKLEPPKKISEKELRQLALDLVDGISTMTLATCALDTAWAAPVYYVYRAGAFFFFSKPDARHVQEALAAGTAGAAIHAHAESWQNIRGVQMSGRVEKVNIGLAAANALRAYLKKFPFTKEFFKEDQSMDLKNFVTRFKVNLYTFTPALVYYLDNQIQFGFREAVRLK